MLLTYSKDKFVDAIKNGTKIHTIREDPKQRWKPGMAIQHWRGNPRNVRQKPYHFATGECKSVQEIEFIRPNYLALQIKVDGRELHYKEIENLAQNDGLTMEEFINWFDPLDQPPFKGRIIHFTDFKY